ncbi:MAG: ribonuclease E/G [Tissierellia bacterium]|nr:ribonuclease E/G [Tissierellia bacterium]
MRTRNRSVSQPDFAFIDGEAPYLSGLIQDGKLMDINLFGKQSTVGNIYRGRVDRVMKQLDCSFVRFQNGENGYLPKKYYRGQPFKQGDVILVELKKAAMGTKNPVLTMDYSLSGEYLILLPKSRGIRVSNKITNRKDKNRIKKWVESQTTKKGLIVRTDATEASDRQLNAELNYLLRQDKRLQKELNFLPVPKLLLEKEWGKSFFEKYNHLPIRTNDQKIYNRYKDQFDMVYDPSFSIRSQAEYRKQFDHLFSRVIYLEGGGSIVLDQTEALLAIDINTPNVKGKKSYNDQRLEINLEAAREIIRMIQLRNLGGMIAIDFIHGMSASDESKIVALMEDAFGDDGLQTTVYGFSPMGLFELTRQRKNLEFKEEYAHALANIREQIAENPRA